MTSPRSRWGNNCSITASTAVPALTMIMIFRGFARLETNSSIDRVGKICFPDARFAANFSVTSVVRLKIETEKPLLSMLSTRFSPMTARPISPISDGFMSLRAEG